VSAPAFVSATGPVTKFSWRFHLHPDVWLVAAALILAYSWALIRLGPSRAVPADGAGEVGKGGPNPTPSASRRHIVCFELGVAVMLVVSTWPVHDLAEHALFSVHMTQHLMITAVMTPLLLLGMPPWLMRVVFVERPAIYRVSKQVFRPVPAMVIFNAFLVLTHWPTVTNRTTHDELFHLSVHLVMFLTAVCLWMPMINTLPELPRLSHAQRLVYLFVQSIVPTVPASFLTLSTGVVYKAYAVAPRTVGLSPITDQQIAGAVMKLGGGAILWALAGYTFWRWWVEELRRDHLPERLVWDDVKAEMERSVPPPEG